MKKFFTILTCIILSTASALIFFRPMPIIPSRADATVLFARYNREDTEDKIDFEKIADILSRHYTRRTFHNPFSNLVEDTVWEIGVSRGARVRPSFMWVRLGKDSVVFECASDTILHRVIDPESLMYELSVAME